MKHDRYRDSYILGILESVTTLAMVRAGAIRRWGINGHCSVPRDRIFAFWHVIVTASSDEATRRR